MLRGSLTALITPFRDGQVDEPALREIVEFQILRGTSGLVPCGTTGEAATMTDAEQDQVIRIVIEQTAGRIPVIAGTGSNDTARTIHRSVRARALGADAALLVTPYYNRPTQEGLYRHFMRVAEAGDLPVVLYNVPGRTGVDLLPATVARLAAHPTIVGIKEASGSLDRCSELLRAVDPSFTLLSGDDSLTLPIMSLGGQGVISVVSNIVPERVARLTAACLEDDLSTARALHLDLLPLCRAMFLETNPIPVKAAAGLLGLCSPEVRLPLTPISDGPRAELTRVLETTGALRQVEMAS